MESCLYTGYGGGWPFFDEESNAALAAETERRKKSNIWYYAAYRMGWFNKDK